MATSGARLGGVVGYNVQVAVDTEHHLIVTHGPVARRDKRPKPRSVFAIRWRRLRRIGS
jgi:hypothetical protein